MAAYIWWHRMWVSLAPAPGEMPRLGPHPQDSGRMLTLALPTPLFCLVRTVLQIGSFIRITWLALKAGKPKVRVSSDLVSSEGCFFLSRWCLRCSNPLQGMMYSPMTEDRGQRTQLPVSGSLSTKSVHLR